MTNRQYPGRRGIRQVRVGEGRVRLCACVLAAPVRCFRLWRRCDIAEAEGLQRHRQHGIKPRTRQCRKLTIPSSPTLSFGQEAGPASMKTWSTA